MNPPPTCRWCRVTQRAPAKPHGTTTFFLYFSSRCCWHLSLSFVGILIVATASNWILQLPHRQFNYNTCEPQRSNFECEYKTTSPRPCDASSWVSQVTHRPKTHRVATASSLPHWPTELGTSSSEQQCNTAAFGQLTQHLCIVFIVHLDCFLRCQSIGVQICRLHLKGD